MKRLVVVGLALVLVPLIWAATGETGLEGRIVVRSPMVLLETIVASARRAVARRAAPPQETTDGSSSGSGIIQLKKPTLPETISPSPRSLKTAGAVTGAKTPGTATKAGRSVRRRPVGYFTTFGRFPTWAAADAVARRVRAKGYIAEVISSNGACMVKGHTYRTRSEAERMAQIFREIGLPASVDAITVRSMVSSVVSRKRCGRPSG